MTWSSRMVNLLLLQTCINMQTWSFATNDGIYEPIDTLISKKSSLTAARWEQASGFNFEPEGLLFDNSIRGIVLPAEHFIHDWMHAILCNGVFATVLTLWIQAVEATGKLDVYKELGAYMKYWTLPKGKQAQLVNLFSAKKKTSNKEANSFKATASEFLGLYPILANFCNWSLYLPSFVKKKAWCPWK